VLSQIRVDFSMVLNLLLSHTPEEIKGIFQNSFATFLNLADQRPGLDQRLKRGGGRLISFLSDALCGGPEFVLDLIRRRAAMIRKIKELKRKLRLLEVRLSRLANPVPGRFFLDRRGRMYCTIKQHTKQDEPGVLACRVKRKVYGKGGRLRLKWVPPRKASYILETVLELPSSDDPHKLKELMAKTAETGIPAILEHLPKGEKELSELRPINTRALVLDQELNDLVCNRCAHLKICRGNTGGALRDALHEFGSVLDGAHAVRIRLWHDFVKHLAFLKEEGFVTQNCQITHDGFWASQLRLDEPLMVAEGLRRGIFPGSDPALLGSLVAPLVYKRETYVSHDESRVPGRLLKAFDRMKKALAPLMEHKAGRGFEVRSIELWPAVTIYAWANGHQPWERLLEISSMAEGDLAMLVSRTADNLRQIASLTRVYPGIAQNAGDAVSIILRESVVMD